MSVEQSRAYWQDTYLFQTRTEVVANSAEPAGIAVREGIVHPKGGGQPDDVVTVDGSPASVSKDVDGVVWLHPESGAAQEGTEVGVAIDPDARRRHAALHSAGHLLDACVTPLGYRNVGLSHTPGQAFLLYDLDGGSLPEGEDEKAALVERVLERAREHVAAGLAYSAEVDDEGVRRVSIETLQTDPCGGTHVRSTADLAGIAITRVRTKKGQLKLSYTAEHA